MTTTKSLEISPFPMTYLAQLSDFDGKKEELYPFTNGIDNLIPVLSTYNENSQNMVLSIIKGKLKGRARMTMEIHPHLKSWAEIKTMLETNFGGLASTEYLYEDLRNAQFRGDITEFYNYIQWKLSLLNQRYRLDNQLNEIQHNNKTALKIFINKLPIHQRTVLCALKPVTLEQALHELSSAGLLQTAENSSSNNFPNDNPKRNKKRQQEFQTRKYSNFQNMNPNVQWQPENYQPNTHQQHHGGNRPNAYQQHHSGNRPNAYQQHHGGNQPNQYQQQPRHMQQQPPVEPMDISQQTRQNHFMNKCDFSENNKSPQQIDKYKCSCKYTNFHYLASGTPPDGDFPISCSMVQKDLPEY